VQGAGIVIAATTGAKSYIQKDWIEPGTLLVMLSLDDPTAELFLGVDKVIVDDFEQCVREEKLIHRLVRDGQFNRRQVHAEIGEILAGLKPGREGNGETILVNPMGMAIEDIAVGKAVFIAAKQQGLGEYLPPRRRLDIPDGFIFRPRLPDGKAANKPAVR
jgi:ornithine cyclodeaminase